MQKMPPESGIVPDKFVLLNMDGEYVVLAGFRGGYLHGDSWRRSTALVNVTDYFVGHKHVGYKAETESGSMYILPAEAYGFTSYSSSVYLSMKEKFGADAVFHAVEEENFKEILNSLKK